MKPFQPNVSLLYSLKISENLWIFDVLSGIEKTYLPEMGQ